MPEIKVTFWKPMGDDGFLDLKTAFEDIAKLPTKKRMLKRSDEYTDYFVEAKPDGQAYVGHVARIGRNLPAKVNLSSGVLGDLDLMPDEALANEMNFRYDRSLKVLALQSGNVFRSSTFQNFISDLTDIGFTLEPILRQDEWRRFDTWRRIGRLEIRLENPAHHPDLSRTIPSMGQLLDSSAEQLKAFTVELNFGLRAHRDSMDKNLVRKIVQLFADQGENVTKLSARGAAEEESTETVDFIRDRLVFKDELEYVDQDRRLDPKKCQQLLKRAIHQNHAYLKSLV
jgi:hypothetical protein